MWTDLPVRKIRYWCYRAKTEAEGGAVYDGPEGLREHFEAHANFTGWENFSVSWDVCSQSKTGIVRRLFSIDEEWKALQRAHGGRKI